MVLVPKAQEISDLACDIGHDAEITISEAPKLISNAAPSWVVSELNTTLIDESWNSQKGLYASTMTAVQQRAAEMRNRIYQRPEKHIALV
ncbi:phosphoglycerate mutase family protein-like protein [Penicillium pulvis]|uniref:phosphoglycerate mutase family protein-like protein n=1 Tax=Penicillium pulvis TaxID=1562058 RepID=UPI0025498F97|nr:phosphoglycerate mutase family protein-like protein [Penicillium pulvis]KAJ5784342.1 phosphoglycerate mutase family protein-like protein [Penicillium pulvis]